MINFKTFVKPRYLFPLILGCAAVFLFVFLERTINEEKSVNGQLNEVLNDALKEKEVLLARIAEAQKQVEEKEQRLVRLSDAAALRSSLDNAQKVIEQLNADIARVNGERAALQNTAMNLTSRMQGLTQELTRNVEELKSAREELNSLGMTPLKKKSDELTRSAAEKDQALAGLKVDMTRLQRLNQELAQKNDEIAKQLQSQPGGKDSGGATGVSRKVADLQAIVNAKNSQIQQLQDEVDRINSSPVTGAAGGQKRLGELIAKNDKLAQRISDLEAQLEDAKQEAQSASRSQALAPAADSASEKQANKLAQLLVRKDLEIDAAKRDALEAREKLIGLQSKLSMLEVNASQNKSGVDKARELENKVLSLQSKLSDLQNSVQQKTELAETLQKNLAYLAQQVSRKDDEMREVQSRYATVDSSSREELQRQKSRYDEINMLYTSLKTQVDQFSEALNLKEAELDQKKKETSQYREEIAALRSRAESLERDLSETKERQKKTLDDLIASVKLNTVLQDRMRGGEAVQAPSRQSSAAQQKADDLKRRVEIMLEPAGKQP
jgi:chromosome segregation ATPase